MSTNEQGKWTFRFNPGLEAEVRKLFDNDEFVIDVLSVFQEYRETYLQAKKYDLISVKTTKRALKTIVKLTRKMLDLKNETEMLLFDTKPRFSYLFSQIAEYDLYASHLKSLTTEDFDHSALRFCDIAENAVRSLPKNVAHAVAAARQKKLLIPLHAVFRKYGLNHSNYMKGGFGNPSVFMRIAVSGAQAVGDREANPLTLKKLW